MLVAELISELKKVAPELKVVLWSDTLEDWDDNVTGVLVVEVGDMDDDDSELHSGKGAAIEECYEPGTVLALVGNLSYTIN